VSFMTGGQVVVEALRSNGVEVVFGIPGTHSLPIYQHLHDAGLWHVTPRHEQGAGYAADGYARSSGKPGVCLVTTGPGVTNLATALGQAHSDSIPLLAVSPGLPFAIEGGDHGFLHETKNQSALTSNLVAWSHRATSHQDLADAMKRAFRFFGRGRPRPVHIEVPLDLLDRPGLVDGDLAAAPEAPVSPGADAVESIAAALVGGRRRALIAGGGCRWAQHGATGLAERLDMAVVTTANGKGVVSERHPLSLGASIPVRATQRFLDDCDVVLAVGTELGDSDLWGGSLHPRGTFVRVDIDPAQLDKHVPADLGIQADAAITLEALLGLLDTSSVGEGRQAGGMALEVAELRRQIDLELETELAPWRPIHTALEAALEPSAIVAGDAAMACYFGTAFLLPLSGPSQWLYPTGFCTLGYGLPAAIGAKLAHPDRQVLAIMGDGGVMFTLSEFATAAQLRLAIPLVVVNNRGYGEIRREMVAMGFEPVGTELDSPDFPALARGLGGEGARTSATGLETAVKEAFAREGPTLIEVEVA
jgi:thiamine pyrophosphate-dependent acetolactate synthase large subunit-like protein